MGAKVGIIGSGIVGQTLAKGFVRYGYDVMIGTNTPSKKDELVAKTDKKVVAGSFQDAAKFGEMVVFAVKGSAGEAAVKTAGIPNLSGKTVIDTMNPIADVPPVNGILSFYTSPNESLMERLQKLAPEAHFVKAFSCIGNAHMINPDFGGIKPTMFICGNHEGAKADVKTILDKFGFETEDIGKAEGARAIEPLCILWCAPGFLRNEWSHVFKLLKK
jgi:8-hydroxy-5-deazaflavin:NADPH oxidoreductase